MTIHTSTFDLMEQRREFKAAVEFWQQANNIGAVSVCGSARSIQTKSRAFLPGCVCVHPPTMREQEEELQLDCPYIFHPLVLKNRWSFPFDNIISFLCLPRIDKLRLVETMPKQNRCHKNDSDNIFGPLPKNGFGPFSFKFFVPIRVGLKEISPYQHGVRIAVMTLLSKRVSIVAYST